MKTCCTKTSATPSTGSAAEADWQSNPHLRTVLDRLCVGVAILDEHIRVAFANRAFQEILSTGDRLILRQGRIMAASSGDSVRLQSAISRCSKAYAGRALEVDVPIWSVDDDEPLIVSVCTLDAGSSGDATRRPVMLLAVDTGLRTALDDTFLKSAFRLSDAEALVAMRLLEGATVSEIADARGVSLHTARSQLRSVMSKVGVNRQSDLINLLSRCDVMSRTRQPGGEPRPRRPIPGIDSTRIPTHRVAGRASDATAARIDRTRDSGLREGLSLAPG